MNFVNDDHDVTTTTLATTPRQRVLPGCLQEIVRIACIGRLVWDKPIVAVTKLHDGSHGIMMKIIMMMMTHHHRFFRDGALIGSVLFVRG
jgi:hypothetical protein